MSMIVSGRFRFTAAAVATVLVLWLLHGCFRSDEERISDAVDDARDALVERRTDDFLTYFAADVTYLRTKTRADLEADLARWRAAPTLGVAILTRRIEVQGDRATAELDLAVGPSLLQQGRVVVELGLRRAPGGPGGGWTVDRFSWRR